MIIYFNKYYWMQNHHTAFNKRGRLNQKNNEMEFFKKSLINLLLAILIPSIICGIAFLISYYLDEKLTNEIIGLWVMFFIIAYGAILGYRMVKLNTDD